ncbi:bis(5'-nucleosyl)-tetraphosphatase (symmetrical) YqeK [Proteiniborus sp. MB09-C3]|uniref:bis(5'-nucleosyl)-tetraphosphatase (symmetrical) YqeK n=1 Tax=Proteiniborus sp. MB09-C3 TaxID=3050072 RepID=UPI0025547563|nr:bis(5'-nucleosyl)-tetraphosphatase (symmetrical) YqeK [Proteiniborus sp. MB09-C3]WIV10620.1 bis(5'-nucleosyl)-tetraphosphatase (symmetrical) YqeK [Proteiniborus sp. MB09-C3]
MEKYKNIIDKVSAKLIDSIGYERYSHSIRVMEEAIKLSAIFCCDEKKAAIAGLLHDCGKFSDEDELLKNAYNFDIIQRDACIANSALIHGVLGAEIARKEFHIEDRDILSAIRYHTTGRENMTLIEKIIYISDYIEPERNFPGVDEIRKLAYENLDLALLKAMDKTIKHIIDKGFYIHPDTINARNYLINKIK